MKSLVLTLLLAAAALAQVPTHSVIGGVTINVADVSIPTAYGSGTETKAAVSVCSNYDSTYLNLAIEYVGRDYILDATINLTLGTNGLYCGVALAAGQVKDIAAINLFETRVSRVAAVPATVENKAARLSVSARRPQESR